MNVILNNQYLTNVFENFDKDKDENRFVNDKQPCNYHRELNIDCDFE